MKHVSKVTQVVDINSNKSVDCNLIAFLLKVGAVEQHGVDSPTPGVNVHIFRLSMTKEIADNIHNRMDPRLTAIIQRTINKPGVAKIIEIINAGEYRSDDMLTLGVHQGRSVTLNGQHRLKAFSEALPDGAKISILISIHICTTKKQLADIYATIDSSTNVRTQWDILKAHGLTQKYNQMGKTHLLRFLDAALHTIHGAALTDYMKEDGAVLTSALKTFSNLYTQLVPIFDRAKGKSFETLVNSLISNRVGLTFMMEVYHDSPVRMGEFLLELACASDYSDRYNRFNNLYDLMDNMNRDEVLWTGKSKNNPLWKGTNKIKNRRAIFSLFWEEAFRDKTQVKKANNSKKLTEDDIITRAKNPKQLSGTNITP